MLFKPAAPLPLASILQEDNSLRLLEQEVIPALPAAG
jgi:hypothetical protein